MSTYIFHIKHRIIQRYLQSVFLTTLLCVTALKSEWQILSYAPFQMKYVVD